jgi:hypothetical protein
MPFYQCKSSQLCLFFDSERYISYNPTWSVDQVHIAVTNVEDAESRCVPMDLNRIQSNDNHSVMERSRLARLVGASHETVQAVK